MSKKLQLAIKEIAREIAIGNTCYIQRHTAKITTIDNSIEDVELKAAQALTKAELEKKIENYVKIEKLSAKDELAIMNNFLEELSDRSVRKQLSNALKRKNPVRNFNMAVESDVVLNQHWMNFNVKAYQRWVSNAIIDAYNY